jgi:uncharacterized protein
VLDEKIKAVTAVFETLDQEISRFQENTTLHCKWGCGKCCFKPEIEATILEFLPFADHLYRENKAGQWLEKLQNDDSEICHILNPTQAGAGLCSSYAYRGLICRLFGFSARTNKYGKKELVTCQIIKTEQQDAVHKTDEGLEGGLEIPLMSNFYMRLYAVDPELTRNYYPINQAIRKAIELVLHDRLYRDPEK